MARPRVFLVAPVAHDSEIRPEQILRHAPGAFAEDFAVMQLATPKCVSDARQMHHLMADALCVMVGYRTAKAFGFEDLELLSWRTLRVGTYRPTVVKYVRVPEPTRELQAMRGELQHFWTGIDACTDHGPWDARTAFECQECRYWDRRNNR